MAYFFTENNDVNNYWSNLVYNSGTLPEGAAALRIYTHYEAGGVLFVIDLYDPDGLIQATDTLQSSHLPLAGTLNLIDLIDMDLDFNLPASPVLEDWSVPDTNWDVANSENFQMYLLRSRGEPVDKIPPAWQVW